MVSDWRDLSVLIAGCGSIGKRHARVLRQLGVRDLRACDPIPSQREGLKTQVPSVSLYDSFEQALADLPDAVLIGTPPKMHIPMSIAALQNGAHVFCEKPLSDSLEGVGELERMIKATGKKFMVGLCFRYHEGHRRAKAILESGTVGRLVSIRALMGENLPEVRPDYQDLFTSKYGGTFDLMHEIDLGIWYAGLSVTRVAAFSGNYSDIGIEAPDLAEILIDFSGAVMASVHLDFFQHPRRRVTELICTRGVVTVEFAQWNRCTVSSFDATAREWQRNEFATDRDDMFRAEDRDFLESVWSDREIACNLAEAKKSLQVVLHAQNHDGVRQLAPP